MLITEGMIIHCTQALSLRKCPVQKLISSLLSLSKSHRRTRLFSLIKYPSQILQLACLRNPLARLSLSSMLASPRVGTEARLSLSHRKRMFQKLNSPSFLSVSPNHTEELASSLSSNTHRRQPPQEWCGKMLMVF
ncbi:hypothetical protein I3843_01G038400 [Carya illinoinensis]|nr:hypothetical protein I3843_01G038400 [Carya illinoinensis]